MHPDDPFAAPTSTIADPSGASGLVSPGVVETLRRTKGWVRFLAVLGFIGAGLCLLMGLVSGALSLSGAANLPADPDMPVPPVAILVGYAVLLCGAALVYLFPSWRLLRYGNAITHLEVSRDGAALERALEQQRAFWRLVGLIAIVSLVFYVLLIVGGIAFGMFAAMRGGV